MILKDPVLEGRLRGYDETYEFFWGVGVRGVNVRGGIGVAGGAGEGALAAEGTENTGRGEATGGELMVVRGVARGAARFGVPKVGVPPKVKLEEGKVDIVAGAVVVAADGKLNKDFKKSNKITS